MSKMGVGMAVAVAFLTITGSAFAQDATPLLLRSISGTAANPAGDELRPNRVAPSTWTFIGDGSAFATFVTETGPENSSNQFFSTNWATLGVHRTIGNRGELLVRGRFTAEPYTVPREGFPQLLQYVSPRSGGRPDVDRMRAHDLVEELAVAAAVRIADGTFLQLYAAPVGDPALGPVPYAQRSSSRDFAEAPFAYDVQEPFHVASRVITAGIASSFLSLEASTYRETASTGRHTTIESDGIDSWSGRVTLTPSARTSIQLSQSRRKSGFPERKITSGSLSYSGKVFLTSLLWTRDETAGATFTAEGFETTIRLGRGTLLGRAERVDRPTGVFVSFDPLAPIQRSSHVTIGYIFDLMKTSNYRVGIGANADYHTQSHELEGGYGHKPQSVYAFVRVRTD